MRRVTDSNIFVELAEKIVRVTHGAEAAGYVRAVVEQQTAERARAKRTAIEPADRAAAGRVPDEPKARADGSSRATKLRHERRDQARRLALRDRLVRNGAPADTPVPVAFDWRAARAAARCWYDPREGARTLAGLPRDVARRLRSLARSMGDRSHARRVVAFYTLLLHASAESRRGGAAWRVLDGYCRAALAAHLPASERRRGRENVPLHENSISNYAALLVGAGLLDVVQPGGPETAPGRRVLVGPSGWALAQYRLLWHRAPLHNQESPAFPSSSSDTDLSPVPSGCGEASRMRSGPIGPPSDLQGGGPPPVTP